ncbi:Glycerophosphoryl diester phosphodiesterase [Polystyrenella longa]|uniref:Glycerophosphoryl diester phosphodiesterase n=2 Tax=Polystyrenella longa TaxID=2528007 RepID=A0A518CKW4_9PLAN|nr:Glycerophosphoryl diester phosphodiesterase [Polystyrenella longa]
MVIATIASGGINTPALQAVEIVAHRGASHDAPENTLASVNLAWEKNTDGVEIDVYLSKDNQIVAFHDKTMKRTGGGTDLRIVDQTLAELKKLDAGSWKSPKYKGEQIPLLSEILPTIPEGKRLFIEVKCGPEIVPFLKADLKKAGRKADQTCVICFGSDVCRDVKQEMPELKVYWLSGQRKDKETGEWTPKLESLIETAQSIHADGLDLNANEKIDAEFVQQVKQANLGLYVWTVNNPDEANRLAKAGVDGITTDRPAFLRDALEK